MNARGIEINAKKIVNRLKLNKTKDRIPKYNLNIQSLTHGAMTGRQIEEIEKILFKEKPDWLLVYGDTNSTLSGALAAAKMNIKIAHVESGLSFCVGRRYT